NELVSSRGAQDGIHRAGVPMNQITRPDHARFVAVARFQIEVVEPALEPAQTMRRGVSVFCVVAFRWGDRPGAQVGRFGEARGEGRARFVDRLVDFEHQHVLGACFAEGGVEGAKTSWSNDRPRLPRFQVARCEHVNPGAAYRPGDVNCVAIRERGPELMSVSEWRSGSAAFVVDEPEIIRLPLIVPVALAHPLEAIKAPVEDDGCCLDQIEVDGPLLANERALIGTERTAA